MKQLLLKSMVTRLVGLMVAFFMITSIDVIAQTTHKVSSTNEWNTAVNSLKENDIIQLTADVKMGDIPTVTCSITSDNDNQTLSYSNDLEMTAPLTFKNIKLDMSCIYANGHALVFDAGVQCVGTYTIDNGQTTLTGMRNIWGGSKTGPVASTSVVLKSGTFGWVYAGGDKGAVDGEARMVLSGNVKMNGSVFGGGDATSATCGSTHVEISGGTYGFINSGGYKGNVTGECYLKISGDPTIVGTVFGGCNQEGTTAGSTHVEISGGTFRTENNDGPGSIYAGGWGGSVSGCSSIRITGGTMGYVFGGSYKGSCGSTDVAISGGSIDNIYGGGQGNRVDDSSGAVVSCTGGDVTGLCKLSVTGTTQVSGTICGGGMNGSAHVGATDVFIDLSSRTSGGTLSGAGQSGNVKGDVKLVVAKGTFTSILGGGSFSAFEGNVGGHIEMLIKDVTVGNVSLINSSGQLKGSGNITIEGGNVKFNKSVSIKGDEANRSNCTLVFTNCGSERAPYELLATVTDFSSMKLDNSYITPSQSMVNSSFMFDQTDKPFIIEGGKGLIGNFSISLTHPLLNDEVIKTDYLPAGSSFNYGGIYPLYKAGDGYRLGQLETGSATLQKINVMHVSNGKTVVVWNDGKRDIELADGDQVPENELLKLSVVPASGYRLKTGSLNVYKTGDESTTVTLSGTSFNVPDYAVTVTASFEQIPFAPDPDPEPTIYHTVTLPAFEGAITDPVAGDYDVEAWSSFRFYLTLDKEYDQSEPVVTTDRGETIQPRTSDGAYIIKYVRQPVLIKIDGVVKNPDPVANETIGTDGIKIYAANGYLHLQTPQPEQVHIFTPDGRLLKTFRTSGNEERIALPKGIYLIRVTNQCMKVVL